MEKIKLGDLCISSAGQIKEDADALIDYIDISSVDNKIKKVTGFQTMSFGEAPSRARKAVKKGSILVSTVRPNLNAVAMLEDDTPNISVASTGFCILDCKENVDNRFVFNFCKSKPFIDDMVSQATGASYPAVSDKIVRAALVPKYTYEEQCNISEILDRVSNVIESKKVELSTLDDLIQARFIEMFGNPLDKSLAKKYFVECVEFNPKKSEVKDLMNEKVSFVPMECVGADGSFAIKEDGVIKDYYKGYTYFRDGDVLLAKITPCFENGKVAIAKNCTNGIGFGTTEFHVSRPIAGVSNSYWIKYMLKNENVHRLATINMTGSAGQKRIQTPFFEKLKIYLPPIELQNQFADFVRATDKLKVEVQKSLDETQMLFDSLMQKYFG